MIQCYAIAASEVDDAEGKTIAVDVVLRIHYADLVETKDLQEIVRHVGGGLIGVAVEDGEARKVLSVVERRARKKKGAPDASNQGD